MIVVLSYDEFEQGTEPVIDWLINLNANFIKVTIKDIFKSESNIRIDINQKKIFFKNVDITADINVFFYRRIFANFSLHADGNIFKDQLEREITDETITLINYLFYVFKDKTWLPAPDRANVNKLTMLNKAVDAGLIVPKSVIVNNKKDLLAFYTLCTGSIITKPINKAGYYTVGKYTYFVFVNKIDEKFIADLEDNFFPSLFQECVEKDYEVRIFYLDGDFYSVALITKGQESLVDVKQRSVAEDAIWVPYNLPETLKQQLTTFFKSINLNTGSVDVLRTKTGEYVFIEVNPVGQYGAPSHQGNFHLDKKIAQYLIDKDNIYEK
ncbi:grasp-with-spasm system ATP-grasp peptide maturase [Mucilaginibacter sp.]|uniref:grasp-with-spasm system ATP-grasp peptide maturase n=1 Tax=Mucilaginibacter sp. TaxID=1882438 RepID=UPI00283B4E15|nr:grasp-with-spasm system ATP-grasp peptide maturase [Mucilaginibacter sp.]MDR3694231.1 grasp-with-spasm system ATP-grasp peptide maturase [Mucilaginibacter sp.]